jgi:hypothetical protein
VAGNQPGMTKLNKAFQVQGLSESSWPSFVNSIGSLCARSRSNEHRRSAAYPNSCVTTSDWPSKVMMRDWRRRRTALRLPNSEYGDANEIDT